MKYAAPSSAIALLLAGASRLPAPSGAFQPTARCPGGGVPSAVAAVAAARPQPRPSCLRARAIDREGAADDGDRPPPAPDRRTTTDAGRRRFLLGAAGSAAAAAFGAGGAARAQGFLPDFSGEKKGGGRKRLGGMPNKIRSVCNVMDELQRDLMQERWDLVEAYPEQLRSMVPVFTTYTDSAFPTDEPSDKGLRVALRYEVGRFFASVERLRQATRRRALDEAYIAYSDMALHLDRYMHVGGLYTYYDDVITTEKYFAGIKPDELVYADPAKDPALVRDLIVLVKGPDMGKTGIVIGIYPDGSNNCVVKLDKFKGMREIRVVPRMWAAKRLGEQDPDEVFLIPRKTA